MMAATCRLTDGELSNLDKAIDGFSGQTMHCFTNELYRLGVPSVRPYVFPYALNAFVCPTVSNIYRLNWKCVIRRDHNIRQWHDVKGTRFGKSKLG